MRKAKIVCTLGPASSDRETIGRMAEAGMSVARLNASHGSPERRRALIGTVREVEATVDGPIAVLLDLRGPEVRTTDFEGTITLETGAAVTYTHAEAATPDEIGLTVDISAVVPGDRVLLDDGRIETTVDRVDGTDVIARVDVGGELHGARGVNIPGVDLGLDVLTPADREELALAADLDVDFVAASFVAGPGDVLAVGAGLEAIGADIPVIAKIERDAAVSNLDGIIEAAYGVMIARGDLGVECPLEDVPLIQKRIVRRSQAAGVPVITATEMLDSMIEQPRPTRAEASDVANAVLDGTDAVMLSGETAVGEHPVSVVETMDRIVRRVEASDEYSEVTEQRVPPAEAASTEAIARSARFLARDVGASAVVVASESGYTALKAAKFRPRVPIVAATPAGRVRRQLALSWGVAARSATLDGADLADVIEAAVGSALDSGAVASGDTVVVLSGMMTELDRSTTNTLKVHVAAETLAAGRGVVSGWAVGPLVRRPDGDLAGLADGAVLYLPASFEGEFAGDPGRLGGIVHERPSMTGYAAMVARELGIPMASGLAIPSTLGDGTMVTLDGERGVVYSGDVSRDSAA